MFYGSYRRNRQGIKLAEHLVSAFIVRGAQAELVDAKALNLPMLDRMYKKHPPGEAPPELETLAAKIRSADAFVFMAGEYNWSVQPGLKNLYGSLTRGAVLAPGRHRQLLGGPLRRSTFRARPPQRLRP